MSSLTPAIPGTQLNVRASPSSSVLSDKEMQPVDREVHVANVVEDAEIEATKRECSGKSSLYSRLRPALLLGLAALILGWWISAIILRDTGHRWVPQTVVAWSSLLIIGFRFVPNSVVTRPVAAFWVPCIQQPWFRLPRRARFTIGWLCLLAMIFGSAFGSPLTGNTQYGDRAISVLGLFLFQFGFWATSTNRAAIPWPTVIVGLFLQQAVALFVLKSNAGFSIFGWIARLAADFLGRSLVGAAFWFGDDATAKHWLFLTIFSAITFFVAFVQMLHYLGVMEWILKGFAWFFFKLMDVSGAEAIAAASAPVVGGGESACLVGPYFGLMTESELHLTMTSGFSTVAGSVLAGYIALGVPPQNLITSSVMSIPASIAISKMRLPETEEPVTRGTIIIDRGTGPRSKPANVLHAFSKGSILGLIISGQILANVLTILSLVAVANGLLTWVGRGFGITELTMQLVLGYVAYPIPFLLGVPRSEILPVSRLLATKLIANEFAAYLDLQTIQAGPQPLSPRAFTIATYALCGFANVGSIGIQIGVLSALAPSRGKTIARIATSAMICGFVSTLQTAGIAGMLV